MSAYVVGKTHIDYLISAGLAYGTQNHPLRWMTRGEESPDTHERGQPWGLGAVRDLVRLRRELTEETADAVGSILDAENKRSVDHRYDEEESEKLVYRFDRWPTYEFDPIQVIKATNCYMYQSCEHADWDHSEARSFCLALRGEAITRLPGYNEAVWGPPEKPSVRQEKLR